MDVASMNNLWDYLSGLSLTVRNKEWLSRKLLESMKQDKAISKADEVLRQLDGCWARDDMDDSLEHDIMSIRNQEARNVESMDV